MEGGEVLIDSDLYYLLVASDSLILMENIDRLNHEEDVIEMIANEDISHVRKRNQPKFFSESTELKYRNVITVSTKVTASNAGYSDIIIILINQHHAGTSKPSNSAINATFTNPLPLHEEKRF